jgi:hypothetical protein
MSAFPDGDPVSRSLGASVVRPVSRLVELVFGGMIVMTHLLLAAAEERELDPPRRRPRQLGRN